jgi:alkanesulfonate monooxygenase SsuD/methylene tetrahydromethanopterin reductase-like flavin-dependent oxidoreductase (luciferase family)
LAEAIDLVPDAVVDTMTITGTVAQCAARIKEYEGVADELILARTAQRDDTHTLADYDDLFELISSSAD